MQGPQIHQRPLLAPWLLDSAPSRMWATSPRAAAIPALGCRVVVRKPKTPQCPLTKIQSPYPLFSSALVAKFQIRFQSLKQKFILSAFANLCLFQWRGHFFKCPPLPFSVMLLLYFKCFCYIFNFLKFYLVLLMFHFHDIFYFMKMIYSNLYESINYSGRLHFFPAL